MYFKQCNVYSIHYRVSSVHSVGGSKMCSGGQEPIIKQLYSTKTPGLATGFSLLPPFRQHYHTGKGRGALHIQKLVVLLFLGAQFWRDLDSGKLGGGGGRRVFFGQNPL